MQQVILKPCPRVHVCVFSGAPTWAVPGLFPTTGAELSAANPPNRKSYQNTTFEKSMVISLTNPEPVNKIKLR